MLHRKTALSFGSAIGALTAAFALSCGDDLDGCTASRTCAPNRGGTAGSAGAPTSAGTGGAGGRAGGGAAGGEATGGRASGGEAGAAQAGDSGDGGDGGDGGDAGASEGGRGGDALVPTEAGAAGDGGAGGGAEMPLACDRDAQCEDADACNGAETCVAGECIAGTPVECANEDPANCSATCETAQGAAVCRLRAQDTDEDGFKSAACTFDPGDDCHDGDDSIHPGAPEMCDGVDSDCDQRTDLTEDEVQVGGTPGILIEPRGTPKELQNPNIAGRGEGASTSALAPFAVTWSDWEGGCWSAKTVELTQAGTLAATRPHNCADARELAPDVTLLPQTATLIDLLDRGDAIIDGPGGRRFISGVPQAQKISFNGSDEYRVIQIVGSANSNTVRRLRYNTALEHLLTETLDPAGHHLELDIAYGDAVWTLRKSGAHDRVMGSLGNETRVFGSEDRDASHPRIAKANAHGRGLVWRYGDGSVVFRHVEGNCEGPIGTGFPGELAATKKSFVLVSLSQDKRKIVANLLGPACTLGPRAVLASIDEGSSEVLGEPKVAVTGDQIRAVWMHATGAVTNLHSRLFSFEGCE